MKKLIILTTLVVATLTSFTGCLGIQLGGGSTSRNQNPTVGQQLIDLQKAKDSGAINEADYQAQKAKLLAK